MCGIAGIFDVTGSARKEELEQWACQMNDQLIHRGPDDAGVWVNEQQGIALALRRLAIIDRSPTGRQPMVSHCGRYVIVFNGEIYNFTELRGELEQESAQGIIWRGYSDTEVLLAGICQWGVKTTLQKLVGMFAFALWDQETKTLVIARDRMGEKPLYYGYVGHTFLFASELKALRAYPKFPAEIERNVLPLYLRHRYIPMPYSIYQGIYKLIPGCFLVIQGKHQIAPFSEASHPHDSQTGCPVPYWSLHDVIQQGIENPFSGTTQEAAAMLATLIGHAVQGQMIADVPLGAFLSGGIDSSTVAALMQAHSARPVKTFSIGFYERRYNEAQQAKAVAKHLGTEHTELYITEQDALAVIPQLPRIYDEPFADASQIPTFLLSQLTRQHVTVSLSGDGGDELFCGYQRYFSGARLWHVLGWLPALARHVLSRGLNVLPTTVLDKLFFWLAPVLKRYGEPEDSVGANLSKVAAIIGFKDAIDFHQRVMSLWKSPLTILAQEPQVAPEVPYVFTRKDLFSGSLFNQPVVQQMMALDALTYLPDDILVKVDRAAMAVSLETRMPLLDHRIIEFAARLPLLMNYSQGVGKQLLRRVLYRYVPQPFVDRPKMGFGIPLAHWLRGQLREWAESLLTETRLRQEGYFQPEPIRQKWQEHLSGKRHWHAELWDVLMFQAWVEEEKL